MKGATVQNASVDRQRSTKNLLATTTTYDFRLFSMEATNTYLQSSEEYMTDIHLNPSEELDLRTESAVKTTPDFVCSVKKW